MLLGRQVAVAEAVAVLIVEFYTSATATATATFINNATNIIFKNFCKKKQRNDL